eukprot:TRINITY_DN62868_c0_g1_i1.p1 TRINITY_DN62868_c0_g1~~TRINITY_DN62868_c0_g1_i1.p1  ORF type:complete len:225 (-),score=33.66 TRINITY_DN62868_c0_g1_i1:151-825(-)
MAVWCPSPAPYPHAGRLAWDTCWDFSAIGRQGSGFGAFQVPESNMMGPNSPWDSWAMQPTAAAAAVPPWWPSMVSAPSAMPSYWPQGGPVMCPSPTMVGGGGAVTLGTGAGAASPVESTTDIALPKALEKRLGIETVPPPPPPPPAPEKEFEGSLKSLSSKHGYGFIACDEIHQLYKRDVYFPRDIVPEPVKVLDRIKFKVTLSAKGHPQASWAEVAVLEVSSE